MYIVSMKTLIWSIAIATVIQLMGCGTEKKETIELFNTFLGVNYGDKIDALYAVLGEPTQVDLNDGSDGETVYDFVSVYFEKNGDRYARATYNRESEQIEGITIVTTLIEEADATINILKSKGVTDKKIEWLGKQRDDIFEQFGPQNYVSADNYEYTRNNMDVVFICYDWNNYLCSEIEVYWYYSEEEPVL